LISKTNDQSLEYCYSKLIEKIVFLFCNKHCMWSEFGSNARSAYVLLVIESFSIPTEKFYSWQQYCANVPVILCKFVL